VKDYAMEEAEKRRRALLATMAVRKKKLKLALP